MTQTRARGYGFFVFVLLAIPFAAFAAKPINVEIPATLGQANVSATSVQWQATGTFDRLVLNVSGPDGFTFTKEFAAGTAATLRLQDLAARVPADGQYTWELRVVPRIAPDVRQKLAQARAKGDDALIAQIQVQNGLNHAISESGSFTIQSGMFIPSGISEPGSTSPKVAASSLNPKAMDVVTADDAIIQGSACIGLDCVNNESFGFDTLRLKENNTRIKFDDTSTTAGCPNNDWQLTANDACGGSNKFSIEDITGAKVPFTILAAAPTNSIFVDSSGKVGFGTASPGLNLHITIGDTPAIRMEQTNASGFTAQTWDIGANEANWFVRDLTGGSRLPLRIRPGAPTSSVDIAASGFVGIGTASPSQQLHVFGTTARTFVQASNNTTAGLNMEVDNAGTSVGFGVVRTENNGDMDFFTGVSGSTLGERVRILSAGNVGIGTSAPASKLHVSGGDIRVTGGSFIDDGVTLNAPDYVFDSSYQLMPIAKLADYIRAEKHLPNVPSANNIKSNGLNMSQFQMRLLEKVEELTLYTIDLKAQNDDLQKRLDRIEQQVKNQ